MKVLVVDCHSEDIAGRHKHRELMEQIKASELARDESNIIEVRTHRGTQLDDFLYQQQPFPGLPPSIMAEVKKVFNRFDTSGNGKIDYEELELLTITLYTKLGADLTDFDMNAQVNMYMSKFDFDQSGDLDLAEFSKMLTCDPFCTMFPEVNDMKENSVRCLRRFCSLDMIIIDGEASMLPWSPEAKQLLRFVNQVRFSQKMSVSSTCMIGSAVLAQILQYLGAGPQDLCGPVMSTVFNGTKPGFGSRDSGDLHKVDVKRPDVVAGACFLDNSSGTLYQYKVARVAPGEQKGDPEWLKLGTVGMVCNGSRPGPKRRWQRSSTPIDNTKVLVEKAARHYKHPVFNGTPRPTFVAICDRAWDLCAEHMGPGYVVLGESQRGPELFQLGSDPVPMVLAAMFPYTRSYPDTSAIFLNFIELNVHRMTDNEKEDKDAQYQWLVREGAVGRLHLQTPEADHIKGNLKRPSSHARSPSSSTHPPLRRCMSETGTSWARAPMPLTVSLGAKDLAKETAKSFYIGSGKKVPKRQHAVQYRRGHANSHTYTFGKRSEEMFRKGLSTMQLKQQLNEMGRADPALPEGAGKATKVSFDPEAEGGPVDGAAEAPAPAVEEEIVPITPEAEAVATTPGDAAVAEAVAVEEVLEEALAEVDQIQEAPDHEQMQRSLSMLSSDSASRHWSRCTRRQKPKAERATNGQLNAPTCRFQKLQYSKTQRSISEELESEPVGMPWKREPYVSQYERSRMLSKMRKSRYVSGDFHPIGPTDHIAPSGYAYGEVPSLMMATTLTNPL